MPRPVRPRTSLPSHQRAAKAKTASGGDHVEPGPSSHAQELEEDEPEPVRPPTKQKKTDKLIERRNALLAKITAGATPYSKSHNRREKRAARPSEHLNTTLAEVEAVLPNLEPDFEEAGETGAVQKAAAAVKGAPKLTSKKRQQVLTDEALRLPAVMNNPAFVSDPFATIRLHTLNTLKTAVHHKAKPTKAGRR